MKFVLAFPLAFLMFLMPLVHGGSVGANEPRLGGLKFLIARGGSVFFGADDGIHGRELWISDGTSEGTRMVRDINPDGSSHPFRYSKKFAVVDGTLFFVANDGTRGHDLWKSDGTKKGTRIVKDFTPSRHVMLREFTAAGGKLFFSRMHAKASRLWKSNGTPRGTRRVPSAGKLPKNPEELYGWKNKLFFSAQGRGRGRELWKSNGWRGGTKLVNNIRKDDAKGALGSRPRGFAGGIGTLYFVANDGARRVDNTGIWKTDGSWRGTRYVRNVDPKRWMYDPPRPYPEQLTTLGDRLFFVDTDCTHGREVWTSDGTPDGTVILDLQPGEGECGRGSNPHMLEQLGDHVYFLATVEGLRGLWKSNGTPEGTVRVADVPLRSPSSVPGAYGSAVLGDSVLFIVQDPFDASVPYALWKSDGTLEGTTRIKEIPAPKNSYPREMTVADDLVFFLTGVNGELWKSDGTPEGTGPVLEP